jgi:hypothetical protein
MRIMRIKIGRLRALLTGRTAWVGISVPRSVMRRETDALLPMSQPSGVVATLRLAWACARSAWRCSKIAAKGST